MTDMEIKIEDDIVMKDAYKRSKQPSTNPDSDNDDDRIANDVFIDIKMPSDTRNYYNTIITKNNTKLP